MGGGLRRAGEGGAGSAVAWIADVAATLAIFTFSFAFGNSSCYDAYWSGAAAPERQLLVLAVLLLWPALAGGARPLGPLDTLAVAVGVVATRLPRPPRWAWVAGVEAKSLTAASPAVPNGAPRCAEALAHRLQAVPA